MPDKINKIYECGFCSKYYKIKSAYDKHFMLCSLMNKSSKERKSENEQSDEALSNIPSLRDMYNIIQILIVKNDKLEKQVSKMSSWIHNNKKKVNVSEWLNENRKPFICYNRWVETIEIDMTDMEFVIKHNFIEGSRLIVKKLLGGENLEYTETLPIRAFDQKENTLYVFNECEQNEQDIKSGEWNLITSEQFDLLFNKITRGLIGQLKAWQDKYKNRLFESGFTEKYIENIKKLTGGDLTKEQQYYKIKQMFYNNLKVNIKNIIQYEFVF